MNGRDPEDPSSEEERTLPLGAQGRGEQDDGEEPTLAHGTGTPRPVPRSEPVLGDDDLDVTLAEGEAEGDADRTLAQGLPRPADRVPEDSTLEDATLDVDRTLGPAGQGRSATADEDPGHTELVGEGLSSLPTRLAGDPPTDSVEPPSGSATRAPAEASSLEGAPEIPDVVLEDVLGRGGQGVVYLGRQTYIDRRVAVKVLAGSTSERFEARFRREARILAGLQHASVVACYQAGVTVQRRCFMVMELIEGPDLAKWIRAHGALPLRDALVVVRDVARALEHGHGASIIHRDVKSQNVLLAPAPDAGGFGYRAKLADLGLARGIESDPDVGPLTVEGMILGTPSTMAPEQFDDPDSVDFRADVYGLGCVLFHALTGRPAFSGRNLTQALKEKVTGEVPDPCAHRPEVPASLSRLVRRMLAPEREERPGSYAELIRELETEIAALEGGAAPAAAGRRRPVAAVAGLAVAGLVALVAWAASGEGPDEGDDGVGVGTELPRTGGEPAPDADSSPAVVDAGAEVDAPVDEDPIEVPDEAPPARPALATGERVLLFEAWGPQEFGRFLEGWSIPAGERGRWFGEEDDLSIVRANIARGELLATRPLPGGDWSLAGELGLSETFGGGPGPRAGVRLVAEAGGTLELALGLDGRVRWSASGPGLESGSGESPAGADPGAEPSTEFELVALGGVLELRVAGATLARLALDGPAPARLGLFVDDGLGRWQGFRLQGR